MWVKDAVVKALGDVIGKMAVSAQSVLMEELRGHLWCEVRFSDHRPYILLDHLEKHGVELYRSGTRIQFPIDSQDPAPLRAVYRYQGHLVCVSRTEKTTTINHTKGLDFEKMKKLAHSVTSGSFVIGGSAKDDDIHWDRTDLVQKKLHKGREVLALEADLSRWLVGESVFRRAGLPHRRGWLLYGKPGNGKTSAIQQLAAEHRMNIYLPVFTQGRMVFAQPRAGKHFFLIEDIDNIFRGREALKPNADFGNFLNTIDGVNDLDNCVVVITTNDLTAIDPAIGRPRDETQWNSLSTRPGRIDRCIYFDNPDHDARLGIAKKMLSDDEATRLATDGDGLSVAQFSAIVRERAMEVVSEMVGEEL